MVSAYGSEHARLRGPVAKAFTRRIEAMRPQIEKIVAGLLDELAGHAPGEVVDLRGAFANQVPARVICDLLGVPDDARSEIRQGIASGIDTTATPEQAAAIPQPAPGRGGAGGRQAPDARRRPHQRPHRRPGRGWRAAERA